LHHIFPLNFCETALGKRGRAGNSLLNIAYLTQLTNLQISDRNPVEYVKDYAQHRVEIERTHLLPCELFSWALAGSLREDALDTFIDARIDLLLERLRRYLDGIPFEVVDTRSTTQDGVLPPQDLVSQGSQGKEPTALRESVLEIGAEGGSVTILRERKAGDVWRFQMKTDESALEDVFSKESQGMNLVSQTGYVHSFHDALGLLDEYPEWVSLYPLKVHPEFLDMVLLVVRKKGGPTEEKRWREALK